jgi:uncharacterized DUF497 family protein
LCLPGWAASSSDRDLHPRTRHAFAVSHFRNTLILADETLGFDGFDWDEANLKHPTRHGISDETEQAVRSGLTVSAVYERNGESRYSAVAQTVNGTPIDIAFTIRNGKLRPITVHKMKRSRRRPR